MEKQITLADRRAFLAWLCEEDILKERGAVAAVRFMLAAAERTARLRIVQDASYVRPLLVVSAAGRRAPGLLYQTRTGSIADVNAVITELKITEGPVYLAPLFPRRLYNRLFQNALERIEPLPEVLAAGSLPLSPFSSPVAGEDPVDTRAELLFLIDQALERRDHRAFRVLVAELKKMPDSRTALERV